MQKYSAMKKALGPIYILGRSVRQPVTHAEGVFDS